ncbi:hypothetical protein CEN47_08895, partial [Fischerella thermalis CCMEE 5319]
MACGALSEGSEFENNLFDFLPVIGTGFSKWEVVYEGFFVLYVSEPGCEWMAIGDYGGEFIVAFQKEKHTDSVAFEGAVVVADDVYGTL